LRTHRHRDLSLTAGLFCSTANVSLSINATSVLSPTLANLTAANCSVFCDILTPIDCEVSTDGRMP
jgi:hypothetical protein